MHRFVREKNQQSEIGFVPYCFDCLSPSQSRALQNSSVHLIILQVKIILTHFSSNPVFPCSQKKSRAHTTGDGELCYMSSQVTSCYLSKYKQMSPCRCHPGSGRPSPSSPCWTLAAWLECRAVQLCSDTSACHTCTARCTHKSCQEKEKQNTKHNIKACITITKFLLLIPLLSIKAVDWNIKTLAKRLLVVQQCSEACDFLDCWFINFKSLSAKCWYKYTRKTNVIFLFYRSKSHRNRNPYEAPNSILEEILEKTTYAWTSLQLSWISGFNEAFPKELIIVLFFCIRFWVLWQLWFCMSAIN